jgi:hypothetical protein
LALAALAGVLLWLARRKERERKNKLARQSISSGMLGDGSAYTQSDWGAAHTETNRFSNMSHFTSVSPVYAKLSHQPGGDQFVYQQQGPIEMDSTQQVGPQELPATEASSTAYGGYGQYGMTKGSDGHDPKQT